MALALGSNVPGLTDDQLAALGLATSGPAPAKSAAPVIPPILPTKQFDPTQPLHTPGGVLPAIMQGGQVKSDPGTTADAGELAKRGLIGNSILHEAGKAEYEAGKPILPPITSDPKSLEDWHLARQAQMKYESAHPWGAPISEHPGVLGKIGHIAATVGNIAGDILAPNTMANIPGTQRNRQLQEQQNQRDITQDTENASKEALTAATKEATAEGPEKLQLERDKLSAPEWKNVPGIIGPNGEPVELNEKTGEHRYGSVAGAKPIKQPGETQEQNRLGFQAVIGKLDAAGLPTGPKQIDKSLDTALARNLITKEDHAAARAYQSANPTPATNLTVHIAGQEEGNQLAIKKLFEGKEVLAHMPDGRRVQMSYADAQVQNIPQERLVALSSKEAQENRDKYASTDATFQSLSNYRKDFKGAQLTDKDRDAMRVLASHTQDGTTAGVLGNLIEDLPLAGPVTSYANKLLNGTMTSDQYNQLSPAGKKLVSDYFTAVIANFANMKNIMGSVGRNPMQLQAEINTIPLPYLDWQSANDAFENKRSDLQRRAASQPEIYQPSK